MLIISLNISFSPHLETSSKHFIYTRNKFQRSPRLLQMFYGTEPFFFFFTPDQINIWSLRTKLKEWRCIFLVLLHTPALVSGRYVRALVWRSISRDKAFCYALLICLVRCGSAQTRRCSWCWNAETWTRWTRLDWRIICELLSSGSGSFVLRKLLIYKLEINVIWFLGFVTALYICIKSGTCRITSDYIQTFLYK